MRRAAGRDLELIPQVETARGRAFLAKLLAVDGGRRTAFGHLDIAVDLRRAPDWDALALARSMLVLHSRLADAAAPIDSVTPDIRDIDRLWTEADAACRFGFGGKQLIHPSQVAAVAAAFAPSDADLDRVERVIAACSQGGTGAIALDGKMIDKPVEEDAARRILARAAQRRG